MPVSAGSPPFGAAAAMEGRPIAAVARVSISVARIGLSVDSVPAGLDSPIILGTRGGQYIMLTRFAGVVFGIAIALGIAPAHAADDIEAKAGHRAWRHGTQGILIDRTIMPVSWGQPGRHVMKQVRDFRNGEGPRVVMAPPGKDVREAVLRKVAAYFASKPRPAKRAGAKAHP